MKVKATKLTYYNGRQYLKGEVIEIRDEDASTVAAHYGIKTEDPKAKGKAKPTDPDANAGQ